MRTSNRRRAMILAASVATSTAGLMSPAWAANQTWDSLTTNASWSPAANWSAGPLANSDLLFFGPAATTTPTNDLIGRTFNGITFNADAASYNLGGNLIHLGVQTTGTGITNASDIVNL